MLRDFLHSRCLVFVIIFIYFLFTRYFGRNFVLLVFVFIVDALLFLYMQCYVTFCTRVVLYLSLFSFISCLFCVCVKFSFVVFVFFVDAVLFLYMQCYVTFYALVVFVFVVVLVYFLFILYLCQTCHYLYRFLMLFSFIYVTF